MSAAFLSPLMMTPVEGQHGRLWIIDAPLAYRSEVVKQTLVVPAGFICDLNSMPRLAWIVSPKTDYPEAGTVHDFLYFYKSVPRATADAVYREALGVLGMGRVRRTFRWAALRAFGWHAYNSEPS
jgi:hypothetical protein